MPRDIDQEPTRHEDKSKKAIHLPQTPEMRSPCVPPPCSSGFVPGTNARGGISEAPVPVLNKAWYNLLHERSEGEPSGLSQESSDHNRAKRNLESPTTFFFYSDDR
jgi:hypothetical protein